MAKVAGGEAVADDNPNSAPYAEVAVDARTNQPGDTFTYAVPENFAIALGHLVRVPFGPRLLNGVVVGLTRTISVGYTKLIHSLVEPQPILTPARLALAGWVADYYMVPLFDAMTPMLPPGLRSRSHRYVKIEDSISNLEGLTSGAGHLLAHLRSHPRPHRVAGLVRSLGPWVPNALRFLVERGAVHEWMSDPVARQHREPKHLNLVLGCSWEDARKYRAAHPQAKRQHGLLDQLMNSPGGCFAATARRQYGSASVTALTKAGIARFEDSSPRLEASPQSPLLPTEQQQRALRAINASLDLRDQQPRTWLLQGVTGSGKTEVYLQSIAYCLSKGRRAMVLVPELALTPQAIERFEARFPGRVGAIHSGLTPAQQATEWWKIFRGERDVVIGSRSAVFAPIGELGLIVVDEEHEWAYKQTDSLPRYHARDVAERAATLSDAVVVLGSATPDITSAYRAMRGQIGLLQLPERVERSGAFTELAHVDVVDMRRELHEGNRGVLSLLLQDRLRETLASGQQSVLFLNRRGAATVVECRSCGFVMRCSRCSTPVTFHGSEGVGRLVCHHCGTHRGVPKRCPQCRGDRIRYLGLGTQRLVDEVAKVVPSARILRWDSDSTSKRGAHERLLQAFTQREADVLIGTQMVAKGLDIPSVDLVGVVLADVGLHMPDFRAGERVFQLLTQVAGRAGRGPRRGHVVIQTYVPEHYAIRAAAAQDYHAFYTAEMEHRRIQGNPPVNKLARLIYANSDRATGHKETLRFSNLLRRVIAEWDMTGVEVIGPAPAYPPRVRGAWLWHVLVRAPDPRMLLDKVGIPPAWTIDVDPMSVV